MLVSNTYEHFPAREEHIALGLDLEASFNQRNSNYHTTQHKSNQLNLVFGARVAAMGLWYE